MATFGHQYTWENGFVWEMRGSESLTNPPLRSSEITVHAQGHFSVELLLTSNVAVCYVITNVASVAFVYVHVRCLIYM